MRNGLFTFLMFFGLVGFSQMSAEKTIHDFGDLYNGAPTYCDFRFTNRSEKVQYLLTIDKPEGVHYIFSSKVIPPDSSMFIRFRVDNTKKGTFFHEVDIYFSQPFEPIPIELTGNVKEISKNLMTDCPDFNSTPAYKIQNFEITVKVIDSLTGEPISGADVFFVERGDLVSREETNAKGFVHDDLPLGLYYIAVERQGYEPDYYEGYINFARNYFEIDLARKGESELHETIPDPIVYENIDSIFAEILEEEKDSVVVEIVPETVVAERDTTSLFDLPDTLFDAAHFKFNNITFILDASSSMNAQGKMDLLKMSMIELVKILRPEDRVTVLKYAAEVTILMENETGADKDKIVEIVRAIRTTGVTAGGTAINEAYRLNKSHFIPGGNNIVIIITDGAFNKGDVNYDKTIKGNFSENGTRFSVVGVKTTSYIQENMKSIASLGGGAYIQILTIEDAQTKIIDEIRRTSFRGE